MILLRSLKLNNFLSHKDTEISFPENSQISIEGPSGSGKSSIVDAIIWSLFGKGRSDNRNLIRSGQKEASVELELTNEQTIYKIIRTVNASGKQTVSVVFGKNDKELVPIAKTGLRDHQDWIEKELLHSSYALFINSIAYPQENTDNFVRQTASKRKDLLLEIARVGDYDVYYSRAKDKLKLIEESVIRAKTSLQMHQKNIVDYKDQVKDTKVLEDQIESIIGEIARKEFELNAIREKREIFGVFQRNKDILSSSIYELENNIRNCQEWINTRYTKIKELSNIDIKDIETHLEELKNLRIQLTELEEIERYNSIRQANLNTLILSKSPEFDYNEQIKNLNKQLIELLTHERTQCPDGKHCRCFAVGIEKRQDEIEKTLTLAMEKKARQEEIITEYNLKLSAIGPEKGDGKTYARILEVKKQIKELEKYESIKSNYEQRERLIKSIESEIESIRKDMNESALKIENAKEEIIKIESQIKELNFDGITIKQNEVSASLKDLESKQYLKGQELSVAKAAKNLIEKSELEIKKLVEEIQKSEEELECITLIKDALGSKGIKTIVVDYLIPRLEDTINDIIGQLSEFRVKLETQKQSVDGESVVEGLFISVFNERGEEFEFSNYSGGQKLKISVAISEALASIQKVGFRIFDEAFYGLDENSIDGFSSVIESLQSKFSQILCISHLRIIQDRFENKIVVSREGGISKINGTIKGV